MRRSITPVDLEEAFEESVRPCYPEETKAGWMTFDTVTLMKDQDPIGWSCALAEWESVEADEGKIVTLDNGVTYYWIRDVEALAR